MHDFTFKLVHTISWRDIMPVNLLLFLFIRSTGIQFYEQSNGGRVVVSINSSNDYITIINFCILMLLTYN